MPGSVAWAPRLEGGEQVHVGEHGWQGEGVTSQLWEHLGGTFVLTSWPKRAGKVCGCM